jgi:hypothetical protein
MLTTRAAWFPLRSNIAYFETTAPSLDMEARVKQMAVLSDELLFEPGLLDVTISDSGSWDVHIPISQLSEEDVRKRREAVRAGEPVGFFIGQEAVPGQPAPPESMHQMIGGKLARSFVAEYHLLAKESGLEEQPWVHFGVPNPELELVAKDVTRGLERNAFFEKRQMPAWSGNAWLDDYLRKGLNIDIGRGAALEVPVMLDQLHAPILQWRAEHADAEQRAEPVPGAEALHLWAPNFTELEWRHIISLHDHDAIGEFREKLVGSSQRSRASLTLIARSHSRTSATRRLWSPCAPRLRGGWTSASIWLSAPSSTSSRMAASPIRRLPEGPSCTRTRPSGRRSCWPSTPVRRCHKRRSGASRRPIH